MGRNKSAKVRKTSQTRVRRSVVSASERNVKGGRNYVLHFLQHVLIMIAVTAVMIVETGSSVAIPTINGSEAFNLYSLDQEKDYEDSVLFNTILGRSCADLIRLGTIQAQIEKGSEYDPAKVIDVTAFNLRDSILPEKYITVSYRLENLLKWGKFGFEFENRMMTASEQREFLADTTAVTVLKKGSSSENVSFFDLNPGVNSHRETIINANSMIGTEAATKNYVLLVNKYHTIDGKNIEDYCSSWEDYDYLCKQVQIAAQSLYMNYVDYLKYKDYYSTDRSNLRYVIERSQAGKTVYQGNVNVNGMSVAEITDSFRDYGKYIYYNPADIVFETNTAIEENTFSYLLEDYRYAYGDTTKIWIAVDTSYPISDAFTQGKAGFSNYYPYFWQLICVAIVSAVLYLILILFLTLREGVAKNEEGNEVIRLGWLDRVPFELLIVFEFFVFLGWGSSVSIIADAMNGGGLVSVREILYSVGFKIAVAALIFLFDILFFAPFYSLVRRIKGRVLWDNSLIVNAGKSAAGFGWKIYDNGNVVLRSWVPLFGLLFVNALLALFAFANRDLFLLIALIALVIDLIAGMILYRQVKQQKEIVDGIIRITDGELEYRIDESALHGDNLRLAGAVNRIGGYIRDAVATSMKDERMKADLITNVSHDIKTPLTSIINYVDLLKREDIADETTRSYIAILDEKSQRLKQLIDDLVEASKISSGNVVLHMEKLNLSELMMQLEGEFSEKLEERQLTVVRTDKTVSPYLMADSRRLWRVVENLFSNVCKYAMPGTRVYVDLNQYEEKGKQMLSLSVKNISSTPLNCDASELTERFFRGDESRTTEGSGLGLSIAKNLTQIQGGTFDLSLDGDLFKIVIAFPAYAGEESEIRTIEASAEVIGQMPELIEDNEKETDSSQDSGADDGDVSLNS